MIGLFYYSQTGHTAKVMGELLEALRDAGRTTEIFLLEPERSYSPHDESVSLKEIPDLSGVNQIVLGTPVYGGRMAAPVKAFIQEAAGLEGKQVMLLLTHFLPRQWGAVQTIAAMEALCEEHGAQVMGAKDVTWFSLTRGRQIRGAVDQTVTLLTQEK